MRLHIAPGFFLARRIRRTIPMQGIPPSRFRAPRATRTPHASRTHAQHAPHTLEHREQLLVGRVVERVNQIAHLRKLAFQLVEPRLNPIFLRTREHAQASELLA